MKLVRANNNFYANKDEGKLADDVEALQLRLERVVASWMKDTGHWDVSGTITVNAAPDRPGYFSVDTPLAVSARPLRGEAGGIP